MGNFSRNTFSPQKGYVSVRLQQGVPLVDADWNELSDVTREETYRSIAVTSASGFESNAFDFLAGLPNSPTVTGGKGIVNGRTFQAWPIFYDNQPWRNPATAAADGVPVIPQLTTPTANRTDICYLDVWEREVGMAEDPNIVNPAIGVETSVRLKREVAMRVAEGTSTLPTAPAGHEHLPLARFNRLAGVDTVTPPQREDLRQFLNTVTLVPAFAPIFDDLSPTPLPSWSLVRRAGKLLAANLSPVAFGATEGALSLSLPSGARIREIRVSGQVGGNFAFLAIVVNLTRHRQQVGPTPQADVLAQLQVPSAGAPGGIMPFDLSAAGPSNGTEVVDNARFSYGIFAFADNSAAAEIHAISVSYTF